MGEHSDTLDASSMDAHVAGCARVSTDGCVAIPGGKCAVPGPARLAAIMAVRRLYETLRRARDLVTAR